MPFGKSHPAAVCGQHPRAVSRCAQTEHGQVSEKRGELPGRLQKDRSPRGQAVPASPHPRGEGPGQTLRHCASPGRPKCARDVRKEGPEPANANSTIHRSEGKKCEQLWA